MDDLPDAQALKDLGTRLGLNDLRYTASDAHERTLAAIEVELATIPEVTVATDEFEILRWTPTGDLHEAGQLSLDGRDLPVVGAVPYSKPGTVTGPLLHVPVGEPITDAVRGKVVLRDFPAFVLGYDDVLADLLPGSTVDELAGKVWDRPGFADEVLHQELLKAGAEGAVGVIVAFDLPWEQLAGYFEPHKGTHYALPAVFVGGDERERLLTGTEATLSVNGTVERAMTRNIIATLPGATDERLVLLTHTDGNTWVQENGLIAVIALARSLAQQPIQRTVELAFTSAHLHISREGAQRYAHVVDAERIAAVIAVEHLGTRELLPVPREGGPGRELVHTGEPELLVWCTGPSEPIRQVVAQAVQDRALPRTALLPGLYATTTGQVPQFGSFAGIGTYFHVNLIPATSLISGPWSLWAPSFGADAIDFEHFRQQLLAVADVVRGLDGIPIEELAGEYPAMREARSAGAPTWPQEHPPQEV